MSYKYWINGSGYNDPTPSKVIQKEINKNRQRDSEVNYVIKEIKDMCETKDLKIVNRMEILDLRNNKLYK